VDFEHRRAVTHASAVLPELKTVHRRFQRCGVQKVLRQILTDVANALRE